MLSTGFFRSVLAAAFTGLLSAASTFAQPAPLTTTTDFESLTPGAGNLLTTPYTGISGFVLFPNFTVPNGDPLHGVLASSPLGTGQAAYLGGGGTNLTFATDPAFFGFVIFPAVLDELPTNQITGGRPLLTSSLDFIIQRSPGATNQQAFQFYLYDAVDETNPDTFTYHSYVQIGSDNRVRVSDNFNDYQAASFQHQLTPYTLVPGVPYRLTYRIDYVGATWSATIDAIDGSASFPVATHRPINSSRYTLSGWTTPTPVDVDLGALVSSTNRAFADRIIFDNIINTFAPRPDVGLPVTFDTLPVGPGNLVTNPSSGFTGFVIVPSSNTPVGDPIQGVLATSPLGSGPAGYLGGAGTNFTLPTTDGFFSFFTFPGAPSDVPANRLTSSAPLRRVSVDFLLQRTTSTNQQAFQFYIYDARDLADPDTFSYHSYVRINAQNRVQVADNTTALQAAGFTYENTPHTLLPDVAYRLVISVNYPAATWSALIQARDGSASFPVAVDRPLNTGGYTVSGWTSGTSLDIEINGVASASNRALPDRLIFDNIDTHDYAAPTTASAIDFTGFTPGPGNLIPTAFAGFTGFIYGPPSPGFVTDDPAQGILASSPLGTGPAATLGGAGTNLTFPASPAFFGLGVFAGEPNATEYNFTGSATPVLHASLDFIVQRPGTGTNQQAFNFYSYDAVDRGNPDTFNYHSYVRIESDNRVTLADNATALAAASYVYTATDYTLRSDVAYHLDYQINYDTARWSATLTSHDGVDTFPVAVNRPINGGGYSLSGWTTPSALDIEMQGVASASNRSLPHRLVFDQLAYALSATARTAQSITFPVPFDRPANSTPFQLQATASSGLPVTYVLVSGPATLSGDQLTLTGTSGPITLRALQPGDTTHAPASPVEVTFQAEAPDIGTIPQFIAFSLPTTATFGVAPITLNGTASSSLPLTYTLTQGANLATLTGGVLTITGAGTITVRADQAGDPSFAPATREATVVVTKAPQTLTFTLATTKIALGETVPALTATATSGLPVEYTIVSGPASLGSEGTVLLPSAPGIIKIRADQFGDDNHQSAVPIERTLTITGPALALDNLRQPYTATPRPVTVNGVPAGFEDSLVVTYSSRTYPASTTPPTDAGTYAVTATLGTVKKTGSLIITKAALTVFVGDATRLVGQPNPVFDLSYAGFLGEDSEDDITTHPTTSTTATVKSPAGSYPVTFKGGLATNYTFAPASASTNGTLTVIGFGGTYEALLVDEALTPVGKLVLTVPANALTFSGTLSAAAEGRSVSFKSLPTQLLIPSPEADAVSLTDFLITLNGTAYNLDLTLDSEGSATGTLTRDAQPFATLSPGARRYVPAPRSTAPWSGTHTFVLLPAANLFTDGPLPAGSGHASASIDAKGSLKLTGKLADGSTLTATVLPDDSGTYRLYLNPYGTRTESFLAGSLALQPHPDSTRYFIPAADGLLIWQKAPSPAKPLDKSYRDGFGPLGVPVNLDPWLAPSPALTLPRLLDLTESNSANATLDLALLPELLDLGTSGSTLPSSVTVTSAAKLTVPLPNPRAFRFTSFNAKTGAFTGSFSLSDPSTTSTRPVLRPVTFSGTLRQPPSSESAPVLGAGHFLVPDLLSKTAEQPSAGLQFTAPPAE